MSSGYEFVTDSKGDTYAVDTALLYSIVRNYATSKARLKHAATKTLSHPEFSRWNPLSWGLPDLHQVEVDWKAVRKETTDETKYHIDELHNQLKHSGRSLQEIRSQLLHYITTSRQNKTEFFGMMRTAQRQTMKNIDSSVGAYKSLVKGSEVVRDTSATTLLIGATFISGGAALGVAGAGSTLKGVGKYQATGSWGLAGFEAVSSFTLALIPIGAPKGLSGTEKFWLGFAVTKVEVGREVAMGLVEAEILKKQVNPTRMAADIGGKQTASLVKDKVCTAILDNDKVKFSRLSLPAAISLRLVGRAACNMAVDEGQKAAVDAVFEKAKNLPRATDSRSSDISGNVLFADDRLAHQAILGPNSSAPAFR